MLEACKIPECETDSHIRGWCRIHYERWLRWGDPLELREPPRGATLQQRIDAVGWDVDDNGCHLWRGAVGKNGYGALSFNGKKKYAHRASLELRIGRPVDRKLMVRHLCGTPLCINPGHLALGTQKDNMADKIAHGRQPRGELMHNSKLTESDVHAVRRKLAAGQTQRAVAAAFGVSDSAIRNIHHGRTWGWLHQSLQESDAA